MGSPLICRQPNSIKPPAAAAPVDGAVRSPAGAVRGARGAGMATTGELEGDLRYIIPGRFAWCCIPERILARDPEPKIAGARCFCTDSTFVYEQFFADFGPLNLGCVVRYCRATAELLQRCGDEKLVLVHYCSDHRHRRTNAAFLACAFAVVALRWTVRRAYLIYPRQRCLEHEMQIGGRFCAKVARSETRVFRVPHAPSSTRPVAG